VKADNCGDTDDAAADLKSAQDDSEGLGVRSGSSAVRPTRLTLG
jgi:hypothetical protein